MKKFNRIYIEISNICNLQCSFCPEVLRPKKMMEPDFFKKILLQAKPLTDFVTLHVMGEPLAHPRFPEFVKALEEIQIPAILTSNGFLIERHQDLLLSTKSISQINFSIHSHSDNFPQKDIFPYLKRLVTFGRRFLELNPEAFVNFRLWNLPATATEQTEQNQVVLNALQALFSEPILPQNLNVQEQKSYRLERHFKLHFDTQFEWPSLNANRSGEHGFCYGLKNQLAVLTEGHVVPCCLDKEAVIHLGNLHEQNLTTIIDSPRAQAIVAGFSKGLAIEPLCQKCQFKMRFQKRD